MKKGFLGLIFLLLLTLNVDSVSATNDSKADLMGYEIDLDVYSTYKTYDTIAAYTDYSNIHVGYIKLYSASYERLDDSDSWVVINYAKIEPIDGWINWYIYANAHTDYAQIYTDIDDQYQSGPYGSFYSSEGYDMMNPTPTAEPDITEYEVGLELQSGQPPVFSLTSGFSVGDLEIDTFHSWSAQNFNVKYVYGCSGLLNSDCSYRNTGTEQRAAYKIDKSGETYSPYRCQFIQRPYLKGRFYINSGWSSFYLSSTVSNLMLY